MNTSSEVFQTLLAVPHFSNVARKSSSRQKRCFWNFANQMCFLLNFRKFLRTPFFIEHLRWLLLKAKSRSSCLEVFCKKRCFWKFRKPKVFSREFFEIFKNTFFHRTLPVAASEKLKTENTCARASFFIALGMQLYLNGVSDTGLFLWILRTPFYRTHQSN